MRREEMARRERTAYDALHDDEEARGALLSQRVEQRGARYCSDERDSRTPQYGREANIIVTDDVLRRHARQYARRYWLIATLRLLLRDAQ